jgi:CRP/FNR family transcriptional regulator, anaerobic regulatory protein
MRAAVICCNTTCRAGSIANREPAEPKRIRRTPPGHHAAQSGGFSKMKKRKGSAGRDVIEAVMAAHGGPAPSPAFGVLRSYLEARAAFTGSDLDALRAAFTYMRLSPGDFLQRAGDVARHAAFVATGCLRNYVIDAKGKEHIVQFAPETWWLADATSLATGEPSAYFVDAIEPSELLLIDGPSHLRLIDTVAGYAAAFRTGLQRHAAAKDQRIVSALSATAEERYLEFLRVYPSIASRVPQAMLAAYLGMTPETVSRIRKNLSRRR